MWPFRYKRLSSDVVGQYDLPSSFQRYRTLKEAKTERWLCPNLSCDGGALLKLRGRNRREENFKITSLGFANKSRMS